MKKSVKIAFQGEFEDDFLSSFLTPSLSPLRREEVV